MQVCSNKVGTCWVGWQVVAQAVGLPKGAQYYKWLKRLYEVSLLPLYGVTEEEEAEQFAGVLRMPMVSVLHECMIACASPVTMYLAAHASSNAYIMGSGLNVSKHNFSDC